MANQISVLQPPKKDHSKISSTLRHEQRKLNRTVRQELHRFADVRWLRIRSLAWFGFSSYRLRQSIQSDQVVWWVERDIPPRDRYRCIAYQVQLRVDKRGQSVVSVHSGKREILVSPMNVTHLRAVLNQASLDPRMIIPRQIGNALDP